MKMRSFAVAAIAALMAVCGSAFAARTVAPPKAGTIEVSASKTVSVDLGPIDKAEIAVATAGVYVTPTTRLSLSASFLESNQFRLGPAEVRLDQMLPALDATGETVPYLGIAGGLVDYKGVKLNDLSDLSDLRARAQYGGQIGAQHYLTDNTAVFAEVNYRTRGDIKDGRTIVLAGLSIRL